MAAFYLFFWRRGLFLSIVVGSAVVALGRDPVDLNALGPRHSEPRKLRRIAAEGFVFARCVMLSFKTLD